MTPHYDSTLPYPRDLVGYGRNPPHAQWPGQARIAVQFVLNYEEGGENAVLHGDTGSEQFLSEMFNPAAYPARHLSMESSTKKLLGVVALVYVLPVVGFLLGYFLSEGLLEGWRYGIAVAAAVLAFLPSVAYDRYARRKELLTYTILRVF